MYFAVIICKTKHSTTNINFIVESIFKLHNPVNEQYWVSERQNLYRFYVFEMISILTGYQTNKRLLFYNEIEYSVIIQV